MLDANGNIPFIDVETTGLNAQDDHLLEIAVIVTDSQLNVLDEEGFHAIVYYDEKTTKEMHYHASRVVQDMHNKTGLWEKLYGPESMKLAVIDLNLRAYLARFGDSQTMPVAGNSVRLDMNFIDAHLPMTSEFLHYQMRDVTTVAKLAQAWYPDLPEYEKLSDHTAMVDIKESIRELKHYREVAFRKVSETDLRAKLNQVLIEYGMGGEFVVDAFELHSWRCYYPDIYEPCDHVKRLLDDMVKAIEAG